METLELVLQSAAEFEQRGRDFYLDAAARVTDPIIQSVLRSLANDEASHAMVIRQYQRVVARGQREQATDQRGAAQPAALGLQEVLAATVGRIGRDATYQGVYENARELELASRDFYRAHATRTKDLDLGKVFRFLAAVEQTHLEALELLLSPAGAAR